MPASTRLSINPSFEVALHRQAIGQQRELPNAKIGRVLAKKTRQNVRKNDFKRLAPSGTFSSPKKKESSRKLGGGEKKIVGGRYLFGVERGTLSWFIGVSF